MGFTNHSGRDIWLGVYCAADRFYALTMLPQGLRLLVKSGHRIDLPPGLPERLQFVPWPVVHGGVALRRARVLSTSLELAYAEDSDGLHLYQSKLLPNSKDKTEHIFVLMMENRSFDHLLGWLYDDDADPPPRNIPPRAKPTYDGLKRMAYWNHPDPSRALDPNGRVFADKVPAGTFDAPNPSPPQVCPRVVESMFGTETPVHGVTPPMSGFIKVYSQGAGGVRDPAQIMLGYTPAHVPIISSLAKQYAVCDRWFSSIPCMTHPNRGFLHAGSCFGRLNNNNGKYDEGLFPGIVPNVIPYAGKRTIFDELDALSLPFGLYTDSLARVTLLGGQFFDVLMKPKRPFSGLDELPVHLADATLRPLPAYTFIEPEYLIGANDGHPPADIRISDKFIGRVFDIIKSSQVWNKSMLVVTYDEHGGCFDHAVPPYAARPDASTLQFNVGTLDPMQIYGPRVPAVVVSPFIKPGTVFRSPGTPHDHTSILSTLRDFMYPMGGAPSFFLGNPRIVSAPTLWMTLLEDADPFAAIQLLLDD